MDFSNQGEGHADGEPELVFYYDRNRRIARAPKIVQDYYDGKLTTGRQGLFRSLVATRANRFLFFSVVLCAAAVMFMWYFGPRKDRNTLHAVPVSLTAFSFMDTVYAAVTFDDATKKYVETDPVLVSAEFSFVDTDGQRVLVEKTAAKYDGTQQKLATTCTDYDILEVTVLVQVAQETVMLSANVEKK